MTPTTDSQANSSNFCLFCLALLDAASLATESRAADLMPVPRAEELDVPASGQPPESPAASNNAMPAVLVMERLTSMEPEVLLLLPLEEVVLMFLLGRVACWPLAPAIDVAGFCFARSLSPASGAARDATRPFVINGKRQPLEIPGQVVFP